MTENSFLKSLIDFGPQPVSNRFLGAEGSAEAPRFHLALGLERDTGLVRMMEPFPVEELRPRFSWLTCFEPEDHLDGLADRLIKLPGVGRRSVFAGYSFKDDTTLQRIRDRGFPNIWRVDPRIDLGVEDPLANVETFQLHFTPAKASELALRRCQVDVFVVRHVLEHAHDLYGFLEACRRLVKPGGYLVFEVPDCARALEECDYTTVWEEHTFYFTSQTFRTVLARAGLTLVHEEICPYPFENSLVAICMIAEAPASAVNHEIREIELARAAGFAAGFAGKKIRVQKALQNLRAQRGGIVMWGAGHLSVAFLSLLGVENRFEAVLDDNPHKKGMRMPIGGIPIRGSAWLEENHRGICLLGLNPQNQPKVVVKSGAFTSRGGKFYSIFESDIPGVERIV